MRRILAAVAALGGLLLNPVPASADAIDMSGALDARAAAAREGSLTEAGIGIQASWFSGALAAGATQAWYWNNANPLNAGYKVGFSPVGATTGMACRFEAATTIYMQMPAGERKFYFVIKNVSAIACGTTILLASNNGNYIGNTGILNQGQSQSWSLNVKHSIESAPIQLLAVSPMGATGTASCQIETLRSSYRSVVPGLWEFYFTVRNVGAIACTANLYMGAVQKTSGWRIFSDIGPGETYYGVWYNANPLNAVYLPMASPFALPTGTQCHLEVVRSYYSQVINSSGFPERRFYLEVRNIGVHNCVDVHVYLATIAA